MKPKNLIRLFLGCLVSAIALGFLPASVFAGSDLSGVYLDALDAERSGEGDPYPLFELAAKPDEPLADLASFWLINRGYDEDNYSLVIDLAETHLKRFPGSRHTPQVRLQLAEALCERGEYSRAENQARLYRTNNPKSRQAHVATLIGLAQEGQGKYFEAQQELGEAAHLYGNRAWSRRAAQETLRIQSAGNGSRFAPTRERIQQEIDQAFQARHFVTCGRLCDLHVRLYPGGEAWRYRLKAVDCLLARKKRKHARERLKAIESLIPKNREATAGLMLRWARAERGRGFRGKARTSYWQVAANYPNTQGALLANYWIGVLHFDDFAFEPAVTRFEKFLAGQKQAWLRDEAYWHAGFARYLLGDFTEAVAHFSEFLRQFPNHKDRDRAVYWRARSLEKMDRPEAAADYRWLVSRYMGTYYGLAAQVRMEVRGAPNYVATERLMETFPWGSFLPMMPMPRLEKDWAQQAGGGPELDEGARAALSLFARQGDVRLRRCAGNFLALADAGRTDLALEEAVFLWENRRDVPYASYLVGIMFSLCEENLLAILAANETAANIRQGELFDPQRVNARRQFPLLYWELIQSTSQEHGLDPWLTIALVKQESAFQTKATSWAGAAGLFQVMPGTGKWIARKRKIKGFTTRDLYDPKTSADFGAWYFKRLMDNNEQDVPKSLTGYNAGGSRADRWWAANPERFYDEMIELIVFTETRNYVKIILRNWEMYQRLYQKPELSELEHESVFGLLLEQVPLPVAKPDTGD